MAFDSLEEQFRSIQKQVVVQGGINPLGQGQRYEIFGPAGSGGNTNAAQTLSQAITSAVEKRDRQIKQLTSEIKELSELRDALASAKHLPMHLLRQLLG